MTQTPDVKPPRWSELTAAEKLRFHRLLDKLKDMVDKQHTH